MYAFIFVFLFMDCNKLVRVSQIIRLTFYDFFSLERIVGQFIGHPI